MAAINGRKWGLLPRPAEGRWTEGRGNLTCFSSSSWATSAHGVDSGFHASADSSMGLKKVRGGE